MEEKKADKGYSLVGRARPVQASPMQQPDEWLIRLAKKGDAQAVTALYIRYRSRLLNYLYRLTGDRTLAEDLTQETFLRVVRHLGSYRPTGSPAGWIFRIAKNLALNSFRDRKRDPEFSMEEPVMGPEGEERPPRGETIPHSGFGPDRETARREMDLQIQRALLKLPPAFKETLVLCDIQGCPYKEAAEILRCSINTVASRLARARTKMADLLGYLRKER